MQAPAKLSITISNLVVSSCYTGDKLASFAQKADQQLMNKIKQNLSSIQLSFIDLNTSESVMYKESRDLNIPGKKY